MNSIKTFHGYSFSHVIQRTSYENINSISSHTVYIWIKNKFNNCEGTVVRGIKMDLIITEQFQWEETAIGYCEVSDVLAVVIHLTYFNEFMFE